MERGSKFHRILFLLGLLFFLLGQIILAQGEEFVNNQEPIDFAHWFLFVGVVMLIPQVVLFPNRIYSYVGIPLTLIGIACIIGMCVLDFIWWSFPNEAMRNEFTNHISNVPSIWKPFITIGSSSKVFNVGLLTLSLNFMENKKLGIVIIIMANLILWHIIPVPFRLIAGYTLTLVGFSIVFNKSKHDI